MGADEFVRIFAVCGGLSAAWGAFLVGRKFYHFIDAVEHSARQVEVATQLVIHHLSLNGGRELKNDGTDETATLLDFVADTRGYQRKISKQIEDNARIAAERHTQVMSRA